MSLIENNIETTEHYLAFVDYAGKSIDGKDIYRFDFTKAPDIVWGEQWNATPAGLMPNLQPDMNTLSITGQVMCKHRYMLAKNNTCFSMQDCIDGIIPLLFDEPYSDELMVLPFGLEMDEVISILNEHGLELVNLKDVNEEKDNEVIEGLIGNLETQMKGSENEPPEDDEDF